MSSQTEAAVNTDFHLEMDGYGIHKFRNIWSRGKHRTYEFSRYLRKQNGSGEPEVFGIQSLAEFSSREKEKGNPHAVSADIYYDCIRALGAKSGLSHNNRDCKSLGLLNDDQLCRFYVLFNEGIATLTSVQYGIASPDLVTRDVGMKEEHSVPIDLVLGKEYEHFMFGYNSFKGYLNQAHITHAPDDTRQRVEDICEVVLGDRDLVGIANNVSAVFGRSASLLPRGCRITDTKCPVQKYPVVFRFGDRGKMLFIDLDVCFEMRSLGFREID